MNYSTAVFLINKNVRCVTATYEVDTDPTSDNGKAKRTPFKTLDPDIVKGDLVIVPSGTRHGMTVVRVVETDVDVDFDSGHQMTWIVERVNQDTFNKNSRAEEQAINAIRSAEKRKKADELRAALIIDQEAIKLLAISSTGDKPEA